jgi:ubiquinone/menaquinone biosynthesis C-methylase UbiE
MKLADDHSHDVPSPIDLRTEKDAREWAASAMSQRPWRAVFFQRFVEELQPLDGKPLRILELGSGPGFLAHCILETFPSAEYTMLDFSPVMHHLARERLAPHIGRTRQLLVDFKGEGWTVGLGEFDAIVTNQAVHELRHKKHATRLHSSARTVLRRRGVYLVCDHYIGSDGMTNTSLYMNSDEQRAALLAAGFVSVVRLLEMKGMVLHRARLYE